MGTDQVFPAWAPADVIDRWRDEVRQAEDRLRRFDKWMSEHESRWNTEERAQAETDRLNEAKDSYRVPDLFRRLLTDQRMRPVWESVSAAGNYGKGQGVPHTAIFAACVLRGWMGPFGEETWTPAERVEWLREVAELTEK